MATLAQQLFEMAANVAQQMEFRSAALQNELREIEARKREIEAQLQSAHLARKRLANFTVKIGTEYQCPRCWVRDEARSGLSPLPSDTKDDRFTCDICGLDVLIIRGTF